ncbi:hypothetical protein WA158_001563 [Blastocystis sp. Blastoise]
MNILMNICIYINYRIEFIKSYLEDAAMNRNWVDSPLSRVFANTIRTAFRTSKMKVNSPYPDTYTTIISDLVFTFIDNKFKSIDYTTSTGSYLTNNFAYLCCSTCYIPKVAVLISKYLKYILYDPTLITPAETVLKRLIYIQNDIQEEDSYYILSRLCHCFQLPNPIGDIYITCFKDLFKQSPQRILKVFEYSTSYGNDLLITLCYEVICTNHMDQEEEMLTILYKNILYERNRNIKTYIQKLEVYDQKLRIRHILYLLNRLLNNNLYTQFSLSPSSYFSISLSHYVYDSISTSHYQEIKLSTNMKEEEITAVINKEKDLNNDNEVSLLLDSDIPKGINLPQTILNISETNDNETTLSRVLYEYITILKNNEILFRRYLHQEQRKHVGIPSVIETQFQKNKCIDISKNSEQLIICNLLSSIQQSILFLLNRYIHIKRNKEFVLDLFIQYIYSIQKIYVDPLYKDLFNIKFIDKKHISCYYIPLYTSLPLWRFIINIVEYIYLTRKDSDILYLLIQFLERRCIETALYIHDYMNTEKNDVSIMYQIYFKLFPDYVNMSDSQNNSDIFQSLQNKLDLISIGTCLSDTLIYICIHLKKTRKELPAKKMKPFRRFLRILGILCCLYPSALLPSTWKYMPIRDLIGQFLTDGDISSIYTIPSIHIY